MVRVPHEAVGDQNQDMLPGMSPADLAESKARMVRPAVSTGFEPEPELTPPVERTDEEIRAAWYRVFDELDKVGPYGGSLASAALRLGLGWLIKDYDDADEVSSIRKTVTCGECGTVLGAGSRCPHMAMNREYDVYLSDDPRYRAVRRNFPRAIN